MGSQSAFDIGLVYYPSQQVIYLGGVYQCTAKTLGNLPTNTNYWESMPVPEPSSDSQFWINIQDFDVDLTGNNDSTSGLQAFAAEIEGGAGVLPPCTIVHSEQVTFTSCRLQGSGKYQSTLKCVTKLGASVPSVIFTSNDTSEQDMDVLDLGFFGPGNGVPTVRTGVDSASCSGPQFNTKVSGWRLYSQLFTKGFVTDSPEGHISMYDCLSNSNLYNLYWLTHHGDHLYVGCDFNNAGYSCVYIDSGCDVVETNTMLRVHLGFSPYGIVIDAANGNPMFRDCEFIVAKFEKIGNTAFYAPSVPTGSHKWGWEGVSVRHPVYSQDNTYKISADPAPAAVQIGGIYDDNVIEGGHDSFPSYIFGQINGIIRIKSGTEDNPIPSITFTAGGLTGANGIVFNEQDLDQDSPSAHGMAGQNMDWKLAASSTVASPGIIFLARVRATVTKDVTSLYTFIDTLAGSALTTNENFIGIYDSGQASAGNLSLLQSSPDQSTAWGSLYDQIATITSQQVNQGEDYYIALLSNGTGSPTTPAFARGASSGTGTTHSIADIGQTNGVLPLDFAQFATGSQTVLPGTLAIASLEKTTFTFAAGMG